MEKNESSSMNVGRYFEEAYNLLKWVRLKVERGNKNEVHLPALIFIRRKTLLTCQIISFLNCLFGKLVSIVSEKIRVSVKITHYPEGLVGLRLWNCFEIRQE